MVFAKKIVTLPIHDIPGIVIPLVFLCILMLICAAVVHAMIARRRRDDTWEIDYSELEIGRLLGVGGYGEVHQAMWKGTEVAVKTLANKGITTQLRKSFLDEVYVYLAEPVFSFQNKT